MPRQEKLKIDFEDGGLIYLEGPPDAVKAGADALSAEIARLNKEMSSEAIRVPQNLHRHIIGRSGALGMCESFGVTELLGMIVVELLELYLFDH